MGRAQSSDIDRFLGSRIRKLRLMACVSQQQVAKQLGVSTQQMHKFEKGIDQVSAAQLLAVAQRLDVAVGDLFDGYDRGRPARSANRSWDLANAAQRNALVSRA
jgi:transcriptional regulator with XRE-family HTH domain